MNLYELLKGIQLIVTDKECILYEQIGYAVQWTSEQEKNIVFQSIGTDKNPHVLSLHQFGVLKTSMPLVQERIDTLQRQLDILKQFDIH